MEEPNDIEQDDFVLVKFLGKRSVTHYVGIIVRIDGSEAETKFLRRADLRYSTQIHFVFPDKEDIGTHPLDDIIMKLPNPSTVGGTKRCSSKFVFPCNLEAYDPL